MILSVPFAYDVVGFEPRRRSPSQDRRRGVLDVWIEEVSTEDAPVAAVWQRGRDFERKPQTPVAIRQHAGELWVAAMDSKDTPAPDDLPRPRGDLLASSVAEGRWAGNPFASFLSGIPDGEAHRMIFAREVRDGREEVEAEVRSRAAELAVIDGELHVRCPEPVFVLGDQSHRKASEMLRVDWYEPYLNAGRRQGSVYRLDEWDRLLVDAKRVHDGRPGHFDLPDEQKKVEVLLPDAFLLPTEGSALSGAAFRLMCDLGDEVKRCAETARRSSPDRGDNSFGDPMAWNRAHTLDMPDPVVMDAWIRLGGLLGKGLDETSADVLREISRIEVPVHDSRWRFESLIESLADLRGAVDRWEGRPSRFVSEDVAAFADIGPMP